MEPLRRKDFAAMEAYDKKWRARVPQKMKYPFWKYTDLAARLPFIPSWLMRLETFV